MKTILILATAGMMLLTGCMNTYDLTRDPPDLRRDEVSSRLPGKVWTIERIDGLAVRGLVTAASPDTITFVEESSQEINKVPTRDLARISSSGSVVGPVLGLLGGALLGGMIGMQVGGTTPTPQTVEGKFVETYVNSMAGGYVGVLIGAPIGLAVGGIASAGSTYLFNARGGGAGGDTLITVNRQDFVRETETSVTFRWEGKERMVPKNAVKIYPQGEVVRIIIPRVYIRR